MRDQLALPAGPMPPTDSVDLADVVRTLSRQWRAFFTFVALGILGSIAVILFAPRRYYGMATVLARSTAAAGASLLGRMPGVGEMLGGVGGIGAGSSLETELQMLRSRALAGQVVDSLNLQVRVSEPSGIAAGSVVKEYELAPSFRARTYAFERTANG